MLGKWCTVTQFSQCVYACIITNYKGSCEAEIYRVWCANIFKCLSNPSTDLFTAHPYFYFYFSEILSIYKNTMFIKVDKYFPRSTNHVLCLWIVRVTVDMPSTNLVLNKTFALLNMPSLRDTMMNCNKNHK